VSSRCMIIAQQKSTTVYAINGRREVPSDTDGVHIP